MDYDSLSVVCKTKFQFYLLLLDLLCGIAMLAGVGELVSKRMQKLDQVLPKKRLCRGFGVLAFGGALCFLFGGLLFREYRKI